MKRPLSIKQRKILGRNKYNARKTVVDGITFDSNLEAKRWCELKLLERAGEIENLERQKRFDLCVEGQKITSYVADFVYLDRDGGVSVIEDAKGVETPEFRIKWSLARVVLRLFEFRLTKSGALMTRRDRHHLEALEGERFDATPAPLSRLKVRTDA